MFYDQLKKLCYNNGTSPTRIALSLGMSRGNVTHWKNGSKPSIEVLQKIADYFGVTTDYLLNGNDYENATKKLDLDNDIIVINRAAQKMSPEKRKKMMTMLQIAFEKEFSDGSDNENDK